jgi:hypothetical protein
MRSHFECDHPKNGSGDREKAVKGGKWSHIKMRDLMIDDDDIKALRVVSQDRRNRASPGTAEITQTGNLNHTGVAENEKNLTKRYLWDD